ncbi:hypothetical protein COP1_019554 [Malus domestica]
MGGSSSNQGSFLSLQRIWSIGTANLVNTSSAESSLVEKRSICFFFYSFLLDCLASSHNACFSAKAYEAAKVSYSPMISFPNKGCLVGNPFLNAAVAMSSLQPTILAFSILNLLT